MKRSIWFLLIILIISGGTAWYVSTYAENTTSSTAYIRTERSFQLNDQEFESLAKIVIQSKQMGNQALTKKGDAWFLDDALLSPYAMAPLLQAINTVEVDHIPHRNALQNIHSEIQDIGLHIQLYDASELLLRSYYVGGGAPSEKGTYYLMEGSQQPYVVKMPFFDGSTRNSFIIKKNEMRDRTIIVEPESEIVSIQIDYPREQEASFRLTDLQGKPKVQAINSLTNNTIQSAKKTAVEAYIHAFTKGGAEYIDNDNPKRDSISNQLPFAIIKYELADGRSKELSLFPLTDILDEGEGIPRLEMLVKIERYFAECSWGDFLLLQQRVIGKWLRSYDYFI